jgi:hypothetical protein
MMCTTVTQAHPKTIINIVCITIKLVWGQR